MPCDLILVLDAPSPRAVAPVLTRLAGTVRWVKIGLEMFTACGPDCVREVAGLGFDVFLDLKLHDIPTPWPRPSSRPPGCPSGCSRCTPAAVVR